MEISCLNIKEPYLSFILDGKKTIEGRLNKGKFNVLKVGDRLLVGLDKKLFIIERISHYKTFKEMLTSEGFCNVIPNSKTVAEAEAVYYKIYTEKEEKKFGVLALKIKAV